MSEINPDALTLGEILDDMDQQDSIDDAPQGTYVEPEAGYASWYTSMLADMANDVDTKIRVYAKARFPDEDVEDAIGRYSISKTRGGKIVYTGDDGKLYAEQGDGLGEVLKRFTAGMGGEAPLIAAETYAAYKNLPLKIAAPVIAAGAGLTSLAKYALTGEEIDERDLVRQGINVGLGTTMQGVTRAINSRDSVLDGLESLAPEERVAITNTQQAFKDGTGIDLPLDQASGQENTGLNVLGGWLRTRISSSDRMSRNLQNQVDEMNTQLDDFGSGLNAGRPTDPSVVASEAVGTAKKVEAELKTKRTQAVEAEYNAAKADGISVDDVAGAIQMLESMLPSLTGKQKALYKRYIDDLMDEVDVVESVPKVDEFGLPVMVDGVQAMTQVTRKQKVPTTNMERVHNARIELDLQYNSGTVPANIYLQLRGQFDAILKANPKFAAADAKFEVLSDVIAKEMNSIFGRLAAKQRDDLVGLVNDFFTPTKSSPFMVDRARRQIVAEDPALWNDMVRVYFAQALNAARKQEAKGAGNNVMWNLHKTLWKDKTQRDIMKAALTPQQYEQFSALMERARLVGLAPNIGSPTEPRQAVEKYLRGRTQGVVAQGIQMLRALNWLESTQAYFSERTHRAFISDLTDTFMRVGGIDQVNSMIETSARRKAVTGTAVATTGNVGEATVNTMLPSGLGMPNNDINSDPQPQGLGLQAQ